MRSAVKALAVSATLLSVSVAAQPTATPALPGTGSAQGDLSVTIYNNDVALVQDVRTLTLSTGQVRQSFPDVSAAIRPETVSLAMPDTTVVEQNFDYDLLSPSSLMEKAVGETITLIRTNPATGAQTMERARVLAVNGGVVLEVAGHIEVLRDDGLPVRAVSTAYRNRCAPAPHSRSRSPAPEPARARPRCHTCPAGWGGTPTMWRCSTTRRAQWTCRAGSR